MQTKHSLKRRLLAVKHNLEIAVCVADNSTTYIHCNNYIKVDSPILTILIPSSSVKNLRATDTFSSFCERNVGRLVCFGSCLPERTSMSVINLSPSHRSVSRLPMCLLTVLRCSLAHLVKVFCWIRFHCASSASSRSVAAISSSSPLLTAGFGFVIMTGDIATETGPSLIATLPVGFGK